MGVVKKNTLGNFLNRLAKVEKLDIGKDEIISKVQKIGEDIAREEYAGTDVVVSSRTDNSSVTILAEGDRIAYMEFGTGIEGEGTYPEQDKLPTEPLTFNSRGAEQTTQGWQYNYYKKQHIEDNPNLPDWKGFKAQAQMFNTSERLQNELGEKLVKEIKGA